MANDTRQGRITPKHATTSFHSHSTKLNFPAPVSMTSTTSVFNNLVILFTRKTAGKIEKLPEHGFAFAKPLLVCQCTLKVRPNDLIILFVTPVFLKTALDDNQEHLTFRPSQFHTLRCRRLKFFFPCPTFNSIKDQIIIWAIDQLNPEF